MLLLLSGDVELNPGPMIDDKPDISLLLQWLEPLVDWQPFGRQLPGLTADIITIIEQSETDLYHKKKRLITKWLSINKNAKWKDVISALKRRKETELMQFISNQLEVQQCTEGNNDAPSTPAASTVPSSISVREEPNLLQTINDQLQVHQCTGGNTDAPTSTVPVVSTVSSSVSVIKKQKNCTTSGDTPSAILRMNYATLVDAITNNLYRVTNGLYAKGLIPMETVNHIQTAASSDVVKSGKLMSALQQQLESSQNPEQYLTEMCRVLINQQHHTLTDIATSILHQLGQSIPDNVTSISSIPDDIQGYADNMRQHYKHQPIVATDWPPRIGKDFFGRLALVEKQDSSTQAESAWHLLRGEVDKTVKLTGKQRDNYASSSLLEIISNLSRHVQVIGFSKQEISTVIIQTLQKDTKLAQELIDNNKHKSHFTTTQSSKDSQLAVKLINDLKVRNDFQSLCYVPLVCSMVILVYCKEGGHLPTTLTQLYENFILQTIRRHVKRHDINPRTLGSLSSLPSQLAKPLQEMCQLAYTNLANTRMIFSSHEVQSLSEAVKEDYLGLMTTFTEYDVEKYQFLHLSIQEFLAAWWIAKHEKKTEEVFKDHFDDDHFRMCLRFVAGLTHLEHESYQQYFNKQQLDLQCKREPLFGFETCHLSYFYHNPEIRQFDHIRFDDLDNVPILLLQLLYESQNTTLCQALAQSINNHSLCLERDRVSLSLFDWLCLSYCINNSNYITWNHLHMGIVSDQELSVFTAGLTNNSLQTQCKRLEVGLGMPTHEEIHKYLQPSLLYNIQECCCELLVANHVPCLVLLQFLNLPQLKILHLRMEDPIPTDYTYYTDKCTELEKCIEMNSTLQEMKIVYEGESEITSTITSVIRGVTRNKTITSLTIHVPVPLFLNAAPRLPDGLIEQLLKDNNKLQVLSLDIVYCFLPSSLNIVEVNTPLTALEIGSTSSELMTSSLLPHIKGLHCLILHLRDQYPPHLIFLSHPSLHTLTLQLYTAESAIELFTILQTNTILKALSVEIEEKVYTSSMGTSLEDMLTQNQTLKYLEINNERFGNIPDSFLPFLITGLRHNTSLQQLSVSIQLNEEIRTFINVISQKNSLMEFRVNFKHDWSDSTSSDSDSVLSVASRSQTSDSDSDSDSDSNCSEEEKKQIKTSLFYEQVLPAVTNMLQSHTTIRLLRIKCEDVDDESSQPNWIELVQHLYEIIFIHSSLEYIGINAGYPTNSFMKDTLKDQKKTLIDRHKKEQPHKPLPIVKV
uniref:Death domain-containing protein n=2 Tax=Amphimedon queenslandica TaxID=400682 RepID=A0A1X7TN09_AMPQE